MGHTQIAFIIFFLIGLPAQAQWQATINRMGFFGRIGGGAIYTWNDVHSVEGSLGLFAMDDKDYGQINMAYRYSRWQVQHYERLWTPMQVGVFLTRALPTKQYFKASPSKYPSADYYDQTALRGGLEFGTSVMFSKTNLGVAYHMRVLDAGLIAFYNNAHRDLQYYVSSALSLRYQF